MKTETVLKPFSFERAALLLRNRILDDLPTVTVAVGVLIAMNVLSLVFGSAPFMNTAGATTAWPAVVAIGGILLGSRAFERMQDGRSGPDWLLLPASSTEKYLTALFAYIVAYPIFAVPLAWGLSAAFAFFGTLLGTGGGHIWNPIGPTAVSGAVGYLAFSVFAIAGSARFRKFAIGKTIATIAVWGILLAFLFGSSLYILAPELRPFTYFNLGVKIDSVGNPAGASGFKVNNLVLSQAKQDALLFIFESSRWISVAFAAIYGFAIVKEKEARDEVQ